MDLFAYVSGTAWMSGRTQCDLANGKRSRFLSIQCDGGRFEN